MKIDAINIITKLGVISRKDIMFIVEHEINYDTIFFIEKSLLGIYLQVSVYYENSITTPFYGDMFPLDSQFRFTLTVKSSTHREISALLTNLLCHFMLGLNIDF
jgi:hypothetical protein